MKPTSLFCLYECGLNDYASFDNVIILGREQPAAPGMSDQARAMWWDSEEPHRGLQDKSGNILYMNEPRGYRAFRGVLCRYKCIPTGGHSCCWSKLERLRVSRL